MLAQIAIDIVAHRAVVNRGVQVIVLSRCTQVSIEHQGHDEFLAQRVLFGIHAVVSKNLKTFNGDAVGMAQIVIVHVGHRRCGGYFAPSTAGELGAFSLGCILGQFLVAHRDRLLRLEPRPRN